MNCPLSRIYHLHKTELVWVSAQALYALPAIPVVLTDLPAVLKLWACAGGFWLSAVQLVPPATSWAAQWGRSAEHPQKACEKAAL